MNYLFDTNILVFLYDKTIEPQHSKIYENIVKLNHQDQLYVSILSLYELEYSISNAELDRKIATKNMLERIQQRFEILSLSKEGAFIYGELKSQLRNIRKINRENLKKNNIDIMLASSAIAQSCILISNDEIYQILSEYNSSLHFQNWTL